MIGLGCRWISGKMAVWLIIGALVIFCLGRPSVVQADGTATIEHMPLYARFEALAVDETNDTPFAFYLTISGLDANTEYQFRTLLRQEESDGTVRESGSFATAAEGNFIGVPYKTLGTTAADCDTNCTLSIWSHMRGTRNTIPGPSHIRVRVRAAGATEEGTLTLLPGPTFLDMETNGGWLEEDSGVARDGHAVAVYDGTDLVGLYVAKLNGVNEGYPNQPGYYRVAVPDCTDCGYRVEIWALDDPGTPLGRANIMGQNGCPDTIEVGQIQSLNSCEIPTAVSLTSIEVKTVVLPVLLLLLLTLGGTAVGLLYRPRRAIF
jgi:hypothetical protein